MTERGATEAEVIATVENGERFEAKFGRTGFRRNFSFDGERRGRGASSQAASAKIASFLMGVFLPLFF